MVRCVILAEGDCGEIFEFGSRAEYAAFAKGVSEGSGKYGAGSCGAYELEELQLLEKEVAGLMELNPNDRYRYMDEGMLDGIKKGIELLS